MFSIVSLPTSNPVGAAMHLYGFVGRFVERLDQLVSNWMANDEATTEMCQASCIQKPIHSTTSHFIYEGRARFT